MASILERAGEVAVNAARTAICNGLYLANQLPRFGPLARRQREIGRGIYAAICQLPVPPELAEPEPTFPFEGGQCDVIYLFDYSYTGYNTNGCGQITGTGTGSALGPLSNFRLREPNQDRCPEFPPGSSTIEALTGANPGQYQQVVQLGGAGRNRIYEFTISNVRRQDGLPDECGNPPPVPPPPVVPPPYVDPPPTDEPVTDPDGGPDINFTFAPSLGPVFIGPNGVVNIPVNVNVGGPNIDVNSPINIPVSIALPDFAPTFIFGGSGGGEGQPTLPEGPCCDPPLEPGPEVEAPTEEPVEVEPPPPGQKLVGLSVFSSINPLRVTATQIFASGDEPDLWVPRLGSVFFEVVSESGDEELIATFTRDVDVKVESQFVPAPEGVIVARAFVQPQQGVTMSAVPLYKRTNR